MLMRRFLPLLLALVVTFSTATPAHAEDPNPAVKVRAVLEGVPLVGRSISVVEVRTDPTDAVVSYQWFRGPGDPIVGATGPTLVLTSALLYFYPTVRITATRDGYSSGTWQSSEFRSSVNPAVITPGSVSFTWTPTVNDEVYASTEEWPGRQQFAYQWLLDGKVLSGYTGESIVPMPAWKGRSLAVRATASREYVTPVTVTSAPVVVVGATLAGGPYLHLLASNAVVGAVAQATLPKFDVPITMSVAWFRIDAAGRETPIKGVAGTTYRLTAADIGYRVGIRTKSSAQGYVTLTEQEMTRVPVQFNVYTTPGQHNVSGRKWRTNCEKYSSTQRCRTEIWATQVSKVNGRYKQETGWTFNNLTYLPIARALWGKNPLANKGEWTDGEGRRWWTDCDSSGTGRNACRTYTWNTVIQANALRGGGWTYSTERKWVFNNQVQFGEF